MRPDLCSTHEKHIVNIYFISPGTQSGILLSVTPQSRNVSAGTFVELVCATEESGVTSFGISTTPELEHSNSVRLNLHNGGRQHTLSFIALSEHSSITVTCIAIRLPDVNETAAMLMIQGKRALFSVQ